MEDKPETTVEAPHSPVAARRAVVLERLEEKRRHLRNIGLDPFEDQRRQRLNETLSERQIAELERELSLLEANDMGAEEVPVAVAAEFYGLTAPDILRLKKTGELDIREKYFSAYLPAAEVKLLAAYGPERLIRMHQELTASVTRQAVAALRGRDFAAAALHLRRLHRRGLHRLGQIVEAAMLLTGMGHEGEIFGPGFRHPEAYTVENLEEAIRAQQEPDYSQRRRGYNPFYRIYLPYLRGVLDDLGLAVPDAVRLRDLAFRPTVEEAKQHGAALRRARAERLAPVSSAAKKLAAKPSNREALSSLIKSLVEAGYGDRLVEAVESEAVGLTPLPPAEPSRVPGSDGGGPPDGV